MRFFVYRWRFLKILGVLSALTLGACSSLFGDTDISVRQTRDGAQAGALTSAADESAETKRRREHARILATYGGVYSDRKAEIMVARIVGRLLSAADQPDAQFNVTILDTPDVNAFALSGGYIYVTRGILALANNTSELAAVLAHEIAHITLRHARARSSRARTSAIVDRVIGGILGSNLDTDQTSARAKVSLAAFSQAQELAADKEGVVIAGRAKYEPRSAASFLAAMGRYARFATGEVPSQNDFLSSHPSTPNRVNKALESASGFATTEGLEVGRADYFKAIDGLQFGQNPDHGVVIGRQFIHPLFGFTFFVPKSYKLETSQGAVVGVASDGEAVRFDSAEVPETMPLTDYLQSGWIAGLLPETLESQSHNGIEMASGRAKTDQWVFHVTAVRFKSEVYRFIFAARQDTEAFKKAAKSTADSFRSVVRRDLSKIKRSEIEVVVARAGDTTESFAKKMKSVANPSELFLVLNNLYEGDPLEVGQGYKIVAVK